MTDQPDPAEQPSEPAEQRSEPAVPPGAEADAVAAEDAEHEPDTIAVLARDLRGPVLGNPRQLLTGLLIAMLVVIGLLVGLTALSRQL